MCSGVICFLICMSFQCFRSKKRKKMRRERQRKKLDKGALLLVVCQEWEVNDSILVVQNWLVTICIRLKTNFCHQRDGRHAWRYGR